MLAQAIIISLFQQARLIAELLLLVAVVVAAALDTPTITQTGINLVATVVVARLVLLLLVVSIQ
jgi:hypothetical protein